MNEAYCHWRVCYRLQGTGYRVIQACNLRPEAWNLKLETWNLKPATLSDVLKLQLRKLRF
jgi:hypothetical protein